VKEEEPKANLKASDLLLGIVAMVLVLPMFAVPAQAAFELFYWLREASWLNYDWYMLLGYTVEQVDLGPDMKGATAVVRWLMDTWISLPITLIFGGIFTAIID
jgi:hypothetical protein